MIREATVVDIAVAVSCSLILSMLIGVSFPVVLMDVVSLADPSTSLMLVGVLGSLWPCVLAVGTKVVLATSVQLVEYVYPVLVLLEVFGLSC